MCILQNIPSEERERERFALANLLHFLFPVQEIRFKKRDNIFHSRLRFLALKEESRNEFAISSVCPRCNREKKGVEDSVDRRNRENQQSEAMDM